SRSGFLQNNFHAISFTDGSLYIVHYFSAGPDIIKTNSLGAVIWKKSYWNVPLYAGDFNETIKINETSFMISGYSQAYGSTVVMHIDTTGTVISSLALNSGLENGQFFKISPNKYWLSGTIGPDAAITEFDSSGTFQWVKKIRNPFGILGTLSLSQFNNGQVAMAGLYNDTINMMRGSCTGILNPDGTVQHAFRFGADDSLYGHDNVHAVAMKNGKIIVSAFERILPINSLDYSMIGIIDSAFSGTG